MISRRLAAALAIPFVIAGCAGPERAGDGSAVRAIMASQVLPPQPASAAGTDGAAAVAGYANYLRSYATPAPQADSAMIGSGITGK